VTSDSSIAEGAADPRVARSRERLLTAATDLLVESGPRAVTVDAIAERSGVAKSTLYRHWHSREALLIDVMRANVPDVPPPPEDLDFEEALRRLTVDVATTLAQPEWAGIMPALLSLQRQVPALRTLSDEDREAKIDVLARVLAMGVDEGRVPAGLDPHRVANLLIGPVVFTVLSGHEDEAIEVAEFTVERFLASYSTGGDGGGT
jgi:AcrR family transcriptional regulator